MSFDSVLFRGHEEGPSDIGEPEYFGDLNLDQVVAPIVSQREAYDLQALFHAPLHDVDTVQYRQAACRDLEKEQIRKAIDDFAQGMVLMRRRLNHASKVRHRQHRFRWFRVAARAYCDTVVALQDALNAADVASTALSACRDYLTAYTASAGFTALAEHGKELDVELAAVRYTVRINDGRVTVRPYEGGDDYCHEVEATFSKFDQGEGKNRLVEYPEFADLNHVEARILDLVAQLFPGPFRRLAEYCTVHRDFIDEHIARFDREVQFYLGWLDFIAPMRSSGLCFCYPEVSTTSKETHVVGAFDVALAAKASHRGTGIIPNDFHLTGAERLLVVTGPNQGGKTTFARMFGQLHYLAALGLPVPGEMVLLPLPDQIFTHFEREEQIETLRGKLADELVRVRDMFDRGTADSVFVINEGFSSTALSDAIFLGTEVIRRMVDRDVRGVYVTFVDELATLSEATVSMVATVDPEDPAIRTRRIVRRPADGLAYAAAIAEKYGLRYPRLKERISS